VFSENDDIHHKIVLLKGDLQQQMIDFSSEPGYSKVDFCNTGGGLAPILDTSVEKSNGDATVKVASVARGDVPTQDIHQLMGVASSQMSGGKSLGTSWSPPLVAKYNVRLSLIENSSNSMTARPTVEEVIAFGGIPKSSLGARTSARLGGQPSVDMPQMEKAMKYAQLRDSPSCAGKSMHLKFSFVNNPGNEIIHKA
jgi:hypothetical protein